MPSARSLPSFTCERTDGTLAKATGTRPPSMSVRMAATPLYGMCSSSTPAHRLEHLAEEVVGRAVAGGGVGDLTGLCFRKSDQLLHVHSGQRGIDDEQKRD